MPFPPEPCAPHEDQMYRAGMTIKQLKAIGWEESRPLHCQTRNELFGCNGFRIIGIGRKYVRLMLPGGRVIESVSPEDIVNVWK